jgi:hypothetical protein
MSARHLHRLAIRRAIRAATLVGAAAAALCVQLDGRGKMMRSRVVRPGDTVPEGGSRTGDAHGMIRATQRHEIQAGHDSPGLR